eukprot:gene9520-1727_t
MNYAGKTDKLERTIYVTHISSVLKEHDVAKFFNTVGEISNLKVLGYPNATKKYALVEFKEKEKANESLNLSGTILKGYYINITKSKTICNGEPPECLKNQKIKIEKASKVERTIFVSNIDPLILESQIYECFENCGKIEKWKFRKSKNAQPNSARIQYENVDSLNCAISLSGFKLGNQKVSIEKSIIEI